MKTNTCSTCGQSTTPASVTDQIIAAQRVAIAHDLVLVPVPLDSTTAGGDVQAAIETILGATTGPFSGGEE